MKPEHPTHCSCPVAWQFLIFSCERILGGAFLHNLVGKEINGGSNGLAIQSPGLQLPRSFLICAGRLSRYPSYCPRMSMGAPCVRWRSWTPALFCSLEFPLAFILVGLTSSSFDRSHVVFRHEFLKRPLLAIPQLAHWVCLKRLN